MTEQYKTEGLKENDNHFVAPSTAPVNHNQAVQLLVIFVLNGLLHSVSTMYHTCVHKRLILRLTKAMKLFTAENNSLQNIEHCNIDIL